MKRKIYNVTFEHVNISFTAEPLKKYDRSLSVSFNRHDNALVGLSISYHRKEEIEHLLDAFVAFGQSTAVNDFTDRLNKLGYENQEREPFRTKWELERTFEKATQLKKRLGAYDVEG